MATIIRQSYIDKIERYLGKETIIVLVGQRRVGKSCMMKMIRDRKKADDCNNIIFIDKEKREFDCIQTYQDLNDYIREHFQSDKHNYILIDEIQDIKEFERSIRSYRTEPNTDIIITGSNARMLSNELSTLIGGRYKEIYIQSLSYNEFLEFHQLSDNDEVLALYIQYGGLPGLAKIGLEEDDAREYQMDIYHTVLLKDVIMRNQIRNVPFLENLVRFLADNTGKLISANSISKYMKSQGESIASAAITNYISFLCEAYILHKVNRYDIHGKRIFETNDKFYFEDNGIRNAIAGGTREGDIEKVIENIIYQNLIRLGYQVYVGQLQAGEIDFVCTKPGGERIYVQASYIIADDATREREFGNLRAIKDNYPKYVISMTPLLTKNDNDGITHLHLRKFLTEGI
ncbi:ATP-binding protein [Prevotella copri]|uniref:ATP-binding protein n=1 Tax=Segatella copri TaxID=165179 RepID=A0AAW4NC79_9BACT|nr:ATP-binding protein [Segatella copri]MBU9908837.1 ATP-binding protein [Segatella copri]MBV3374297.1 ATP-binding protein [Segatella copri]MBV3389174.1 ATP-binding protein [Segatella copri]MBV3396963.1 ATP-binding protein [Segatella copri]MBV3406580.1 ATP-binding protein [Segatella copri]